MPFRSEKPQNFGGTYRLLLQSVGLHASEIYLLALTFS
jgi:hypothetical protein